ncbi:MarR family winged helix-turn-helix transcriptional regulator [Algimonas porphyrae]|uniref:HTH marR-type domain-containing protein n=1 Tax=Algimonas porphyrae TaxID=1128113 RepID=A0ABQ5V0R9_9PROT|nr:MarR family transcriptional regulator [Algimonas porphyrae]GLQ21116.1 hypothetical protein GCM10007854_20710 [Algimonas porphyrae]
MSAPTVTSDAGMPTDHDAFKVMVEIEMIAKNATRIFEARLPGSLTRAQFGVLNRLARLDARETISEIARAFDVAQPTMSSTVKRLLDKGYVTTEVDHQDGRRKVVRLTPSGATAREAITQSLEPLFAEFAASEMRVDWSDLLTPLTVLRQTLEAR